jgi:hypothetical protein
MIVSCPVFLRMRNVSDRIRENENKSFVFNKFASENHAVHEIMWKRLLEVARPQKTV